MGAALAGVAIGAGCSAHPTGVLGNGEFRYLCADSADTACSSAGGDTDLPGAIAVGSTFQILYRPNSSSGSVQGETGYGIVAASPHLASTSGDTIAALHPGYEALLARHVGNTTIDDFVHLRFEAIRKLVVSPSTPVTVPIGGQESNRTPGARCARRSARWPPLVPVDGDRGRRIDRRDRVAERRHGDPHRLGRNGYDGRERTRHVRRRVGGRAGDRDRCHPGGRGQSGRRWRQSARCQRPRRRRKFIGWRSPWLEHCRSHHRWRLSSHAAAPGSITRPSTA